MPRLTDADFAALLAAGYAPTDPSARRWRGCEGYALPAAVALARARTDARAAHARPAEAP